MAGVGYRFIRSAFALAEQIAPETTGRVAFELFRRTPGRRRMSGREAEALRNAASFMQEARQHRLRTPQGRVAAHEFHGAAADEAPSVLVVHGWNSRTEHMRLIVEGLRDAGFRVVALDLPGHGASSGRRLDMALAVAAVRAAADRFGPFAAMVGHSFGGAVAVNAAYGTLRGIEPVQAERLVLIASPSSMPAIFRDFGRFLGLGARTQVALAAQAERITGRPLEDFVVADQLAALALPTLAIHAPDDKEVPFAEARRLEEAGRHVRLMRAPGRGHRRILADQEVIEAVVDFALTQPARQAAAGS